MGFCPDGVASAAKVLAWTGINNINTINIPVMIAVKYADIINAVFNQCQSIANQLCRIFIECIIFV